MVTINLKDFKTLISKLNMAVDKNAKLNPKSGWVELKTISSDCIKCSVSNYNYYFEAFIPISVSAEEEIHATVMAETFIPLVSKLDSDVFTMGEVRNCLILSTDTSEYTFPIIKEDGKVRCVDTIPFDYNGCMHTSLSGESLTSIADSNANGLIDTTFSRDYQQYIYVDNIGAVTYTENIYVNDFKNAKEDEPFKFLLSCQQAKLLKVFSGEKSVEVFVDAPEDYSASKKVLFKTSSIQLVCVVQSDELTDKFPSLKIRNFAKNERETHAILNKKELDKAIARLMVFDKKYDATVLDYSQLEFKEDRVILNSVKSHNHETLYYAFSRNTREHTSRIRFADLQNQLKAITTNAVDISYGESGAIVLNTSGLKQLIPEVTVRGED